MQRGSRHLARFWRSCCLRMHLARHPCSCGRRCCYTTARRARCACCFRRAGRSSQGQPRRSRPSRRWSCFPAAAGSWLSHCKAALWVPCWLLAQREQTAAAPRYRHRHQPVVDAAWPLLRRRSLLSQQSSSGLAPADPSQPCSRPAGSQHRLCTLPLQARLLACACRCWGRAGRRWRQLYQQQGPVR